MFSTVRSYLKVSEPINRTFLIIISTIVALGAVALFSASFGVLTRGGGPSFGSVVIGQFELGILPGVFLAWLLSRIHYTHWRYVAPILFFLAVIFNLLLFVPGLGF